MSDKIKRAKLLARFVHFGQKRWDQEPYIKHIERVSNAVKENGGIEDMVIASMLHDCIEDSNSPYHIACLIEDVFGRHIHDLVNILTHLSKTHTYNEYILNVSKNPEALQIKWLDMIDNSSVRMKPKQGEKYRRACLHLQSNGIEIPKILAERMGL